MNHLPLLLPAKWSPDGLRLLTGAGNDDMGAKDNTARIWDSETGKQLLVISGHTRHIFSGLVAGWLRVL